MGAEETLLAYRLAEPRSFLWLVTRDELQVFPLAGKALLSPLIRQGRELLRSSEGVALQARSLCRLSEEILGPALPYLRNRALYVVADGPLEEIPFAALPLVNTGTACREAPRFIAEYELSTLPTASLLSAPKNPGPSSPGPQLRLAVIADPIYEASDPRLSAPKKSVSPSKPEPSDLRRLPSSGIEAQELLKLAGSENGTIFLGPAARRELLLDGSVSGAEILHFAVHGIHDPDQPLLSHLALSAFDEQGSPIPGRLYAQDLYGVELSAELVVLSACNTARGTWIAGEGTVSGLSRGFLFAGAEQVLASLWAVSDGATRRLMVAFYRGLLEEGLPPAQALQRAQRGLWQQGVLPRDWAAFVLQGPRS